MMKQMVVISYSFIIQMLSYLSSIGVNPDQFLKEAGVPISATDSPDKRVSIEQFCLIQENALRVTGDAVFGLHLGEFVEPGSWLILGYIVMNCPTLSEALERICRYKEVVGNFILIYLSQNCENATLSFDIKIPDSKNIRHCYEASVSSTINMIRFITGRDIKPLKVTFSHHSPENISEYERILGSPIMFDHMITSIVFNRSDLDAPIMMHNPGLLTIFEQHAKTVIDVINSENYYALKVKNLVLKFLPEGTPSIERISRELSMSVRSLQTRLSEEEITFRKLIEDVRRELSLIYMKDKRLSIDDIAYLLGFSEPSIFRKNFKKWTGITPGNYRNQIVC